MGQRPPKRARRILVEDGSHWDWVQSPPPTQGARASMEQRFLQRRGYEVREGELPIRPLRTRFIPLAEHLAEKMLVSRVTYRLPTTHPRYVSMAVEVSQRYAPNEDPRENNGLYAVEYPQKDRPFIFSNRREEDACYAAYVASLVPVGEWLFSIFLVRIPMCKKFFFYRSGG